MRGHRRAQSARPQGMSLANLLREAKGGACPPLLRSYDRKPSDACFKLAMSARRLVVALMEVSSPSWNPGAKQDATTGSGRCRNICRHSPYQRVTERCEAHCLTSLHWNAEIP